MATRALPYAGAGRTHPAAAVSDASDSQRWALQLSAVLPALEALARFDARVAGALTAGPIDPRLPVVLHVCAEHADDVRLALDELRIPARTLQGRLHIPRSGALPLPGYSFLAGDREFVIWVFDPAHFRQRLRVGDEAEPAPRMKKRAIEARLVQLTGRTPAR